MGSFIVAPVKCGVGDCVSASFPISVSISRAARRSKKNSYTREDPASSKTYKDGKSQARKLSSEKTFEAKQPITKTLASPKLSIDSLFYWCCERCTMTNHFLKMQCSACRKRVSENTKNSALLKIVLIAVTAADTPEEAQELIPTIHRGAVPHYVMLQLFSVRKGSVFPNCSPDPPISLESYFYWICGLCTRKNSYRQSRCKSCTEKKTAISDNSALLKIALGVSQNARSVKEACGLISYVHKRAIPEVVLKHLITCIAIIGKQPSQRRCLRRKLPGKDFCSTHCDPILLTSNPIIQEQISISGGIGAGEVNKASADTFSPGTTHQRSPSRGSVRNILSTHNDTRVISITASFMKKMSTYSWAINRLNWSVRCIEDTILCQESCPFPLGLLVRRFFHGFGFHDGRIVKVLRRHVPDNAGFDRHWLVYRVLYNDGDNEDLMHHEISSLRQFYDRCNVKQGELPPSQLVPGTMYETQGDGILKIIGHSTPLHASNSKEGGEILAKFCKLGQYWTDIRLDLTKLQVKIVRRLQEGENVFVGPAQASSAVEEEVLQHYDESLAMNKEECVPESLSLSLTSLTQSSIYVQVFLQS